MTKKIDIGRIVEGVFEIYRDHAAVLLPVAAVVFLIEAVVSALLLGAAWFLFPVAILVAVIVTTLYQGMVVSLVSDVQDGRRDATVGQLISSVTPVVLPLIGAGIIAGLAIALGFILLIVPGLILITIWAVFAPAIVVERAGVLQSLRRSRELVKGNGWQVFGAIVIFFLIAYVVSLVFSGIGEAIGDFVGRVILDFIGSVLTAPLTALVAAVLYFNLRAAKGETGPPGGQIDATGGAGQVAAPSAGGQPTTQPAPAPAQEQPAQSQQPPGAQPPGGEQPRPGSEPPPR